MNIKDELSAIRARANTATDGPWFVDDCEGRLWIYPLSLIEDSVVRDTQGDIVAWQSPRQYAPEQVIMERFLGTWDRGQDPQNDQFRDNAEFVAKARTGVIRLTKMLDAVLGLIEANTHTGARTLVNPTEILAALEAVK